MRTHKDVDAAVEQSAKHFLPPLALDDAREQLHAHGHVLQELANRSQVLFGQDLCGCHDTRLKAIVQGDEHGHKRHQSLTRAHVALQQAVHLTP